MAGGVGTKCDEVVIGCKKGKILPSVIVRIDPNLNISSTVLKNATGTSIK